MFVVRCSGTSIPPHPLQDLLLRIKDTHVYITDTLYFSYCLPDIFKVFSKYVSNLEQKWLHFLSVFWTSFGLIIDLVLDLALG